MIVRSPSLSVTGSLPSECMDCPLTARGAIDDGSKVCGCSYNNVKSPWPATDISAP